jgi:hypothetical protein
VQARSVKDNAVRRLEAMGFERVHAYQPQHLFVKNGRRLERVAEPGDPWLVYATAGDRCLSAIGARPSDAVPVLVLKATMPALGALGDEIEKLTGAIRAKRPRP